MPALLLSRIDQKYPLITYQKALLGQATGGKFPSVTFLERKKMSTKTSIKRIAAVAASALAIAGFSAVPAHAAVGNATAVQVSKVSENPTGTALAAGYYTASKVLEANGISSMTVTAGTTVKLALIANGGNFDTGDQYKVVLKGYGTVASGAATATANHASFLTAAFTATTVPGTYTLDVTVAHAADFTTPVDQITTSVTLVVSAVTGFSSGATTAFLAASNGTAAITANGTNTAAIKTMALTNRFEGTIALKNTSGAAYTAGSKLTVSATGVGGVGIADAATPLASQCDDATVVRTASITVFTTGTETIYGCADGTAGTGTISVKFTDADGVTSYTLATWTVTYYSNASALSVSTTNFNIGKAGTTTGNGQFAYRNATGEALSPIDQTTTNGVGNGTTVPAFIVKAVDSSGNLAVSANTVSGKSSDTTVVASAACVLDDGSSTTYSSGTGVGYYNCNFVTAANAKSGSTATITFRAVNPDDATAYITAAAVTVTVGEKVATTALTSDASTYSVGSPMLVTFTAKDSSGKPVYDGAPSPAGVTASKALGGAAGFTGYYVNGVDASASSLAKAKLYAPSLAGDFILTATDSALNALSLNLTAGDDAASGSASLALDAANAATDAANNAYDEAQNATQAASDALAAVTALSAQVGALIATVKSLAAVVAKIKAKVKA